MTFDPKYAPETVDLVFAYDLLSGLIESFQSKYSGMVQRLGLQVKISAMDEENILDENKRHQFSDNLTRDSLVFLHGCEGLRGTRAAKDLSQRIDTRFIVTYDSTSYIPLGREPVFMHDLIRQELSLGNEQELPFSPQEQLSFLDTMLLSESLANIVIASGPIRQYFVELAKLREKK